MRAFSEALKTFDLKENIVSYFYTFGLVMSHRFAAFKLHTSNTNPQMTGRANPLDPSLP